MLAYRRNLNDMGEAPNAFTGHRGAGGAAVVCSITVARPRLTEQFMSTADSMRRACVDQMFGRYAPTATPAHMPFPAHRSQAAINNARSLAGKCAAATRKAREYGVGC